MTLSEYLDLHGLTYTDAAKALGCASQYVSRVARGERNPSPALTLEIERWTGGAVRRQTLRPDVYPEDTAAA
jgi:DNA-binding transcriptional regulator YdaS (Cro superfamily)